MVEKIVKTTFWFTKKGNIRPLSKEVTELSDSFKRITKSAFNTRGVLKETNKTITEMTGNFGRFNYAWLSIMFGGQAIARIFGRIQSSAVKAFTSIMSTVEGASTNVGKLSAHFEYLKFTIGSAIDAALTPLMPMLIRLIEWATDWVQQHPEETFWAIAGAFAAGTVLAVGGAFFLFVQGIQMLTGLSFKEMGGLPGIFTSIAKACIAHPIITAVVAALVILAGLTWKAFKETPEAWEAVKNSLTALKEPAFAIAESMTALMGSLTSGVTTWEDFAWVMAWGLSLGIYLLSDIMRAFAAFIDAVSMSINVWSAMWKASKGDIKGAKRDIEEMKLAWIKFKENMTEGVGIKGFMETYPTPEAFKRESLMQQGYMVVTEGGKVINLGKVDITINEAKDGSVTAEEVIRAIERYTTGGGK